VSCLEANAMDTRLLQRPQRRRERFYRRNNACQEDAAKNKVEQTRSLDFHDAPRLDSIAITPALPMRVVLNSSASTSGISPQRWTREKVLESFEHPT
jgi:hypothetical protein